MQDAWPFESRPGYRRSYESVNTAVVHPVAARIDQRLEPALAADTGYCLGSRGLSRSGTLFESLELLAAAVRTFDVKCVRVIRADSGRCAEFAERSVGLAALHNEELGCMGAAELGDDAAETGKTVDELMRSRRR